MCSPAALLPARPPAVLPGAVTLALRAAHQSRAGQGRAPPDCHLAATHYCGDKCLLSLVISDCVCIWGSELSEGVQASGGGGLLFSALVVQLCVYHLVTRSVAGTVPPLCHLPHAWHGCGLQIPWGLGRGSSDLVQPRLPHLWGCPVASGFLTCTYSTQ